MEEQITKDYSFEDYEVVRQEFVSDFDIIQIHFDRGKVYFNSYTVNQFLDKDYIQILIKKEDKSLVILPIQKRSKDSFLWVSGKRRGSRRIRCVPLYYMVYRMMGWDINNKYSICGTIESARHKPEERAIYFKLEDAICYIQENRKDRKGRPQSIEVFPSEWEPHFGNCKADNFYCNQIELFQDDTVFGVEMKIRKKEDIRKEPSEDGSAE